MADTKRFKFLIMDSSILRNGWRYEMAGLDLASFEKNPICLFMHKREDEWDRDKNKDGSQIVGKWEDLVVENGALYGWVVFDSADEFAAKIEGKVERGFINAVSAGTLIDEYKYDDAFMLPNQTGPTITKWTIGEVSIVDMPNCANAVRAYNSFDNSQFIPKKMEVKPKVTPEQINSLIAKGKEKGLINNDNEASFKALAEIDYENSSTFIEGVPIRVKLADVARNGSTGTGNNLEKNQGETDAAYFNRLQNEAPEKLVEIRSTQPDVFRNMANAYARSL